MKSCGMARFIPLRQRINIFTRGVTCALVALLAAFPAAQAADDLSPAERPITFHLPSQPLGQALARFSESSGHTVLADGKLVRAHVSKPVDGRFIAEIALGSLLEGTGLTFRRLDATTFVLESDQSADEDKSPLSAQAPKDPLILAEVQNSVLDILCRRPLTRPGDYRAVLHLWIGRQGQIERVATSLPSGNDERDAALKNALLDARLGDMKAVTPHSVTIAIMPQRAGAPPPCDPSRSH